MTKTQIKQLAAERKRRGKALKAYRLSQMVLKRTQKSLAWYLKLPFNTYVKYERGERMAPDEVMEKIK